uniref:Protease inhibitor L5H2 n=1 Tax=Mayetiola destructor TaxID=39758 RepID=Q0QVW1_MAYDE|nr:protease inhibitor L5H2 [Mayetiola destructor]
MDSKMFSLMLAALTVFWITSGIAAPLAEDEPVDRTCRRLNEFYVECSSRCDDKYCDGSEIYMKCTQDCSHGYRCRCITGTKRDSHGNCIEENKCNATKLWL